MRKRLAKLVSNVLNPFLLSSAVIIMLSVASTSSMADALKWSLISLALSVLPVLITVVCLVRRQKLDSIFINPRRQRTRVYLMAIACAVAGCLALYYGGAPTLLMATFVTGLAAIVTFMGINLLWKISLHTAFVAASVTILIIVFHPIGALAVLLLPPVAWARLEMKLHTPAQVACGGLLAAAIVVLVFHLFGLISL